MLKNCNLFCYEAFFMCVKVHIEVESSWTLKYVLSINSVLAEIRGILPSWKKIPGEGRPNWFSTKTVGK